MTEMCQKMRRAPDRSRQAGLRWHPEASRQTGTASVASGRGVLPQAAPTELHERWQGGGCALGHHRHQPETMALITPCWWRFSTKRSKSKLKRVKPKGQKDHIRERLKRVKSQQKAQKDHIQTKGKNSKGSNSTNHKLLKDQSFALENRTPLQTFCTTLASASSALLREAKPWACVKAIPWLL